MRAMQPLASAPTCSRVWPNKLSRDVIRGTCPSHPIRRDAGPVLAVRIRACHDNLPPGMSVRFAAHVTPLPIEVHSGVWAIWGHYTRHNDDQTRRNSSRKRDELLLTGSSRPRPGGRVVAAMSASLAGQLRIRS